jgi:hypothetical protein
MTTRIPRKSSPTVVTTTTRPTPQTPTRPQAKQQRPVDRFETRQSAPVVLNPTETPQQERARRIGELNSILNQILTANPPLSEEGISKLLGSQGDNKYEIRNSQLDAATKAGLFDMMRGIHQLGRARIAVAEKHDSVARALLDMDAKDVETLGVIDYRNAAVQDGLTYEELTPLYQARVKVAQDAFGAISVEQEALNAEAGSSLQLGKEVAEYFQRKDKVMSQGPIIQNACVMVVKYSQELEKALARPLTDSNRAAAVKEAQRQLDANLKVLGADAVNDLEKGRRGTIDGLNNTADIVGSIPTPVTRGAALLMRTAANGLEYASGDINGNQLAWKQAAAVIDAAGGQITQKMRAAGKVLADAGFEFSKSLAAELGKIDPKLPPNEQERLGKIAIRTALHNAVTGAYSDAIGASFGEAGKRFVNELARTVVTAAMGTLSTAANEINKTLYDKSLTPEQKAAQLREALWKGLTNAVKTSTEGALEALKR